MQIKSKMASIFLKLKISKMQMQFILKQGIIMLLLISLLFTISFATYKVLLIEYTLRKSNALYQGYSKEVYQASRNDENKLFAYQYLFKELKKNNVVLYNYINPYLSLFLMDKHYKDHIDIDYIIKQNGGLCSFVKITPNLVFHSSQYKSIAYHSNTVLIHFQKPDESLAAFEKLMSKTTGKLYGSEYNGAFNFIIIPNFYGKNQIQSEIDNFIRECIITQTSLSNNCGRA